MSPIEKGILRRKLSIIVENLKALEPIKVWEKKSILMIYIKERPQKGFYRN